MLGIENYVEVIVTGPFGGSDVRKERDGRVNLLPEFLFVAD